MTQTSTDKASQEPSELEDLKKENERLKADLGYAKRSAERYEAKSDTLHRTRQIIRHHSPDRAGQWRVR